ncbi:MAG: class I SAM-dependent methyltransferase [Magnetococcus sp. YQC-9]
MNCPLCHGRDATFRVQAREAPVHECQVCGVLFLHPMPDEERLQTIYQAHYYASWGGETWDKAVREQKKLNFRTHLQRIRPLITSKGRLLDVGAARGELVETALELDFDAYGVERSSHGAAQAKKQLGTDRVLAARIEDAELGTQPFDVITLFDLIEHVTEPDRVLTRVVDHLAPGGVLYLVTPDSASISLRLMGRYWWHYKPEHLFYFNRTNLVRLLEKHGLMTLESGSNRKSLTLIYLLNQLATFEIPLITPIARWLRPRLPDFLATLRFTFPSGELYLLAQKIP